MSTPEPGLRSVEGMDHSRRREASTTSNEDRTTDERRSLLDVLPITTAVGGALAIFLVPGLPIVVVSLLEGDAGSLMVLALFLPWMAGGAAGAFLLGLVVGALAGLPDHLARDRPALRPLTSVLAGGILTVLVSAAWVAALVVWWPHPGDIAAWSTGLVAGAASVATTLVVIVHRHGRRRARRMARDPSPGRG